MNLGFTKQSDHFYRIDNVGADGNIVDYNVASIYCVPGNWIPNGSQTPDALWVVYSGRVQFRYNPSASKFAKPGNAIDWICRNAIGIRSMDSVNGALLTEGLTDEEHLSTHFPQNLRTIVLNTEEHDDFERILENEERIQGEDIENGIQDDWSSLIKTFYDK